MGLLTKFRSTLGMIRTRASSIGARFVSRFPPRTRGILGKVAKVGGRVARVGRVGARFIPGVGAALTVLSVGGLIAGVRKRRKAKRQVLSAGTAISGVSAAKGLGRLAGIKRVGLIAAGIGAAAFVAEQIAEKLGVRGGVGFVGRRPKAPVTPAARRRRRKRRKKKARRIPRHRHKIVRQKARTVVRSVRSKSRKKKRGKRVSFVTAQGQRVSFTAKR